MTPTLAGRMQTRLFIIVLFGIPWTLPFAVLSIPTGVGVVVPFIALAIVLGVGLALDPLYDRMQQRRWDHDWPTWLQVVAGLVEGLLAWILVASCCPLPLAAPAAVVLFPLHYGLVWLTGFLFLQGPIQVLFPHWRFRGGRFD